MSGDNKDAKKLALIMALKALAKIFIKPNSTYAIKQHKDEGNGYKSFDSA